MSLYYDAAPFLAPPPNTTTTAAAPSLKTRIYSAAAAAASPGLEEAAAQQRQRGRSKPAQIYALVVEATKWSPVLSGVLDAAGVLGVEKRLTPALALLLAHDLLLAKDGVAAPREHPLRLAIERHRARLTAELTKQRVRAGFATLPEWRASIAAHQHDNTDDNDAGAGDGDVWRRPRWLRVNTLKTTLAAELQGATFAGYARAATLAEVLRAAPGERILAVDAHIADLVAVPRGFDLAALPAYAAGRVVCQDKASCFPAALLDPRPADGDVVDACAAPGNKTTHLAALMARESRGGGGGGRGRTLYACERDAGRAATLDKMTKLAGAQRAEGMGFAVRCLPRQDFLRLDPSDARFRGVGAILLDPSCSGSGIVGREEEDAGDGENGDASDNMGASGMDRYQLVLPRTAAGLGQQQTTAKKKKRKRADDSPAQNSEAPKIPAAQDEAAVDEPAPRPARKPLAERLAALARFQEALLTHALRFPAARKVVYSTCSVHAAENEHVALAALGSAVGRARGWRVARRGEQVRGLREWGVRGDVESVKSFVAADRMEMDVEEFAEACLRCEKGTREGTMGFFAVMFVRDAGGDGVVDGPGVGLLVDKAVECEEEDEEEWEGFSDAE